MFPWINKSLKKIIMLKCVNVFFLLENNIYFCGILFVRQYDLYDYTIKSNITLTTNNHTDYSTI